MDNISITQLKTNPAKAIAEASSFPVIIESRNKVKAYLLGKEIYEKLISYIEDYIDKKEVQTADFTNGTDFEEVAQELGL